MTSVTKRSEVRPTKRALLRTFVGLALILLDESNARADDATVTIDNFAFTPDVLTVKVGTRVVFANRDDIPHSIVESSGKFRSKALDTDESFAITFDTRGEVGYFCGLHPHMKGKIIVVP
jgi:plastocyanin